MKTNYALRMAVACLLGGLTQSALAVEWGNAASYANESGDISAGQEISIGHLTKIPVIGNKSIVGGSVFYYVKLTLTGGATFSSDVDNANKMTCLYDGTNAGPAVGINVPGNNKDQVTYLLSPGTLGSNPTCTLPSLKIKLNSGQKDYGLQAYVNVNTQEGSQTASNSMTLVTFTQALAVKTETLNSTNKVTVDVRSPSLSKGFAAAGGATQYTALQAIGKISFVNAAGVMNLNGATAFPTDYISKFSITVSGSPIAAGAEVAGQVRSGYVFLSRTDACNAAYSSNGALVAADVSVVSGGSVTLDITDATVPTGGSGVTRAVAGNIDRLLTTPAFVCIKVNGTTTLPKGGVKYSVVATANSGKKPNTTVVNPDLATFAKNGASIKVLNIPGPTNTVDNSFIRIYNMGDAEATVYGTLYDQGKTDASGVDTGGGTVLLDSKELGKIPSKGVLVVSPNPQNKETVNLRQLVGADWEGKAWMQIESDVQQVRVQALVRTGGAGGVTVNVSERVKADGECVQRSDEDVCK